MSDHHKISRRNFCKSLVVISGTFLINCAGFDPNKDWSQVEEKEFSIKAFNKWYRAKKQFNKINPNLEQPHGNGRTGIYRKNKYSRHGATPGIDYRVPNGEKMLSIMDGNYLGYKVLKTGRAGGLMVTLGHEDAKGEYWYTLYAHLDGIDPELKKMELGDRIKRGTPLGHLGTHRNYAKLILRKGETMCFDPDNYGIGHGYMNYIDNIADPDILEKYPDEALGVRARAQRAIISRFYKSRTDKEIGLKDTYDPVDEIRYFKTLHNFRPSLFSDISGQDLQIMVQEFYSNQPFVCTLPWKLGGIQREGFWSLF